MVLSAVGGTEIPRISKKKTKKNLLMKSGNNILPSGRQKVRAASLETVILKYWLNEDHSADADQCSSQMSDAEGLLG